MSGSFAAVGEGEIPAADAAQLSLFDSRPGIVAVVVAGDGQDRRWRWVGQSITSGRHDLKVHKWPGAVLYKRTKLGWEVLS